MPFCYVIFVKDLLNHLKRMFKWQSEGSRIEINEYFRDSIHVL